MNYSSFYGSTKNRKVNGFFSVFVAFSMLVQISGMAVALPQVAYAHEEEGHYQSAGRDGQHEESHSWGSSDSNEDEGDIQVVASGDYSTEVDDSSFERDDETSREEGNAGDHVGVIKDIIGGLNTNDDHHDVDNSTHHDNDENHGSSDHSNGGHYKNNGDQASCPFQPQANRIIANYVTDPHYPLSGVIQADGGYEESRMYVDVAVPEGTYKVSVHAYDDQPGRVSTKEVSEKLRVYLLDGGYGVIHRTDGSTVVSADESGDIPDNAAVASWTGVVDNAMVVPQGAQHVKVWHSLWYNAEVGTTPVYTPGSNPNQFKPICVVFDRVVPAENRAPVITLIGSSTINLTAGTTFIDLGATAFDQEDGDVTSHIIATGIVNTTLTGTYTITYNVKDSQGLAATPVTRTVVVKASNGGGSSNQAPVITLVGSSTVQITIGSTYADLGATALDTEDGNITANIVATGTVNTSVLGTYTITYNVKDSQGLAATPVTRTVIVKTSGGGSSNQAPVITLVGSNPVQVTIGGSYIDSGATAFDFEDGTITPNIIATGTVNTSVLGTYTITYNVKDSQGLAATPVTRTINVVAGVSNGGGIGSGSAYTYGCTDPKATNYNGLANASDNSCKYTTTSGGGGAAIIGLQIFNERITAGSTTKDVVITWSTNIPADSRVVYGLVGQPTGTAPLYGYMLTTATDTVKTTAHTMVITGLIDGVTYYFRPVSQDSGATVVGIELKRAQIATDCSYLKEYLRYGQTNNPEEVTKLQQFLKDFEGFTGLNVTGFFDLSTDEAVRAFQVRYKSDVLDTWNLPSSTGYVYYTTEKKINELYCKRAFPLNNDQLREIDNFKKLIGSLNQEVGKGGSSTSSGSSFESNGAVVTLPIVGSKGSGVSGSVAGASTVSGDTQGKGTVKGGKIALADLLATVPNVSGSLKSGVKTTGSSTGEILSTSTAEKSGNGVLAAVASSFSSFKSMFAGNACTSSTVSAWLLVLAIVLLLAMYARLWSAYRKEKENNNNDPFPSL